MYGAFCCARLRARDDNSSQARPGTSIRPARPGLFRLRRYEYEDYGRTVVQTMLMSDDWTIICSLGIEMQMISVRFITVVISSYVFHVISLIRESTNQD